MLKMLKIKTRGRNVLDKLSKMCYTYKAENYLIINEYVNETDFSVQ